jgi:hypothetical protein
MLAARLCLQMGIVDVEEFFHTVPKRIMDFWTAYDHIEPIGQSWLQTAVVAKEVDDMHHDLCVANGIDREPKRTWEKFMPPRYKPVKKPIKQTRPQTFAEQEAAMERVFGRK